MILPTAQTEPQAEAFASPARRTGVLLAAHGCHDDSAANTRVRRLAKRLESRLQGVPVAVAFQLGTPHFSAVLDTPPLLQTEEVIVVPLMAADGWFSGTRLPEALVRNTAAANLTLRHLAPIGTLDVLIARAAERAVTLVRTFALTPNDTTVLVIGHGTRRSTGSGQTTHEVAGRVRAALPDADVRAVFLDQPPLLQDVPSTLRTSHVVILPYLFGGGGHAREDVPERLGLPPTTPQDIRESPGGVPRVITAEDGRRYVLDTPFGDHAETEGLLVEIVREALGSMTLRLGTRGSRLALWQAGRVADALRDHGRDVRLVTLDTAGDADLVRPLNDFPTDGPFSDALEAALLDGSIDLAMHSLKDLPVAGRQGLTIGATLRRGDVADALVASGGRTLADLPPGASIGTCSVRRSLQLLRLRPDLTIRPIRGTVERRVAQVDDGAFDATILAAAGLERLGLRHRITQVFTPDQMLPEAGQGAVAVQHRVDDVKAAAECRRINHARTWAAVKAERAFAGRIEAAGHVAAAWATVEPDGRTLRLHARLLSKQGRAWDRTLVGAFDDAPALGEAAAALLLANV